ncbi:MAG: phosphopantetheine-binding protein [Thermoleophilaceae bacterium]
MPTATREDVSQRLVEALVDFGADPGEISDDATFEALDVDSLDLVELAQIVEDVYGVELSTADMKRMSTVGDAVDVVVERSG